MLQIRETYVNATKGYQFGEEDWYEPFTQDRGKLFASLQKEYGKAARMYADIPRPDAVHLPFPAVPISERRLFIAEAQGWVFSRRELYEGARGKSDADYYTREVWVQVRDTDAEG